MKFYSIKHRDKEVQKISSSGGAFTAISDWVLRNGGLVVGAAYDYEENLVKHIFCRTEEERDGLRGSKYIQSDMRLAYKKIKEELMVLSKTDKKLLFVGTPCQVAALDSYLTVEKVEQDNLIKCDLVCHGSPSPGLWNFFIKNLTRGKKLDFITFKDKSLGWNQPLAFAYVDGKKISLRQYTLLYFGELISRPSCAKCPYSNVHRVGDITIGDHWSIGNVDPSFHDRDGVSLIIVNTEKGQSCFESITNQVEYKERTEEQCLQDNLVRPTAPSKLCNLFWRVYSIDKKMAILIFDLIVVVKKINKKILKG